MLEHVGVNAKDVVETVRVSGDAFPRRATTADGTVLTGLGVLAPEANAKFVLPLVTAPLILTNALQADGFVAADTSYRYKADLQGCSQVRLTATVGTVSASANSPKLQLRYSAATSVVVANYLIMGATSVEISMFTGALLEDSGWIDLVAGARIKNCFLGLFNIGGDGAADPSINGVMAHFR